MWHERPKELADMVQYIPPIKFSMQAWDDNLKLSATSEAHVHVFLGLSSYRSYERRVHDLLCLMLQYSAQTLSGAGCNDISTHFYTLPENRECHLQVPSTNHQWWPKIYSLRICSEASTTICLCPITCPTQSNMSLIPHSHILGYGGSPVSD